MQYKAKFVYRFYWFEYKTIIFVDSSEEMLYSLQQKKNDGSNEAEKWTVNNK